MTVTIIERVRAGVREEIIAGLRAALAAAPPAGGGTERVILFGSVARGDFDGASDVDVMVVGGDDGALEGAGLWRAAGHRGVEVVRWSPDAWSRALAAGHPMALAIAREGVELWRAPGVAPLR